jgi:pimeloyl-ACP methyl ester carboxylesterase
LVLLGVLTSAWLSAGLAHAQAPTFTPCPDEPTFGCATLSVPVAYGNPTSARISLSIRRQLASPAGPSAVALLALAGGPGQAAVPITPDFQQLLAPALATRDLIVFDQRGTGASDPLQCAALDQNGPPIALATLCADQLGPARVDFTTAQTVQDIESVRAALGYHQLAIYAASYGTKVALEYALAHPGNVQSLLLDSTVPANGPDVFNRSSFAAVDGVLSSLCGANACRGITAEPASDMTTLVARLARRPLRGVAIDGGGHAHHLSIGPSDLFTTLIDGDENPELRAAVPAAVRAALSGDGAPVLRLVVQAAVLSDDGVVDRSTPRQLDEPPFDDALNVDTTCEELAFPWSSSETASAREASAKAAVAAIPASAFAPFNQQTALQTGPIAECLGWPETPGPPSLPSPSLTGIPTLILSGAEDLRTPTSDARAVAATIPGAQVLVVPHTGHSVLSTDVSNCSGEAVRAFYSGQPVAPCAPGSNPFPPSPIPPTSVAGAPRIGGGSARMAHALGAVRATLIDLREQSIGQIIAGVQVADFGGLRAGYAIGVPGGLSLNQYSYVPGVTLSGLLPNPGPKAIAHLRISGSTGAHGTLTVDPHDQVTGRLDGRRVRVHFAPSGNAARAARLVALAQLGQNSE